MQCISPSARGRAYGWIRQYRNHETKPQSRANLRTRAWSAPISLSSAICSDPAIDKSLRTCGTSSGPASITFHTHAPSTQEMLLPRKELLLQKSFCGYDPSRRSHSRFRFTLMHILPPQYTRTCCWPAERAGVERVFRSDEKRKLNVPGGMDSQGGRFCTTGAGCENLSRPLDIAPPSLVNAGAKYQAFLRVFFTRGGFFAKLVFFFPSLPEFSTQRLSTLPSKNKIKWLLSVLITPSPSMRPS